MSTKATDADLARRKAQLRKATDAYRAATSGKTRGGLRLTINDDGPADRRGLDRIFVGLGATIDAFPEALRAALPAVRSGHARNFATESSGFGGWAPLAPRTIAERVRLGFGPGPKLVRTGQLRAHVLSAAPVVRRTAGGYELRIRPGDSVGGVPKYAANARGTDRIPARPMVSLTPAASRTVTSAISRFLRQRAAAHGIG